MPETGLLPGPRLSLAEAEERVGFPILFPSLLGEPDEVHVAGAGDRALVELVYEPDDRLGPTSLPGVGLLLTEFRGDVSPELIGKLAGQGTLIEEVTVNGEPGIWLEGEPHELFYRDPSGEIVWEIPPPRRQHAPLGARQPPASRSRPTPRSGRRSGSPTRSASPGRAGRPGRPVTRAGARRSPSRRRTRAAGRSASACEPPSHVRS